MKKNQLITLCFSFVLLATSCHFNDDDGIFNCEKGNGDLVLQELDVPDFTGINIEIAADVVLYAGDEQLVEVEGQENIVELLELDVQDDVWDIEFDQCVKNYDDLIIHITLPYVNNLEIAGSGRIDSEDDIITDDLFLEVCGSGDMNLAVVADKIKGDISGSGKIRLAGATEKLQVKISGSGDLKAFALESIFAEIHISGSGDVELTAIEELDVDISGSGDVYYRGFPEIDVDISGSGNVISDN